MGKQPFMIQKGELEGMELSTVMTATFGTVHMHNDDPAVDDPGKSLKAFVNLLIAENLLRGLFHQSLILAKKTDTPSVHVFAALLREDGQVVFGCIIVACRDSQYVTHDVTKYVN
jgi:hypothetical protein